MNAITVIEPAHADAHLNGHDITLVLPSDLPFASWLELGRDLAQKRRSFDWLVGDWITYGREHFPEQIQAELPNLIDDEKALKRIEKTCRAFPPHLRDTSLSFDHHAQVADLEHQYALPLLKTASKNHLSVRQLRGLAIETKMDVGVLLPREDDPEEDEMMALIRAWNCATSNVREDFAEYVRESQGGIIDPTGKLK